MHREWAIYEYDVCLGSVIASSADDAIRKWCELHRYLSPAGLFAVEVRSKGTDRRRCGFLTNQR